EHQLPVAAGIGAQRLLGNRDHPSDSTPVTRSHAAPCEHVFVSVPSVPSEPSPRSEATILHADLDAFYASVEQRDHPRLRGRPITVGVARTKFLAKVASGVAKPDGLLVVPADDELGFLHPLPVERLWGVGAVTAAKLHARGVATVGQVAALGEAVLVAMLGRA